MLVHFKIIQSMIQYYYHSKKETLLKFCHEKMMNGLKESAMDKKDQSVTKNKFICVSYSFSKQFHVDYVQLLLSKPAEEEITSNEFRRESVSQQNSGESFKLDKFASLRFRASKKKDLKKRIEYSKDPIKESLLELIGPQNTKAVETFLSKIPGFICVRID